MSARSFDAVAVVLRMLLPILALAAAIPAVAQPPVGSAVGSTEDVATGGRLYGHIFYGQTDPASLVQAPAGFAISQPCFVQPALVPDLTAMVAAEHASGVKGDLRGISCFRSIAHQTRVFCDRHGAHGTCADAADRSESVAPPGHSEHGTGYAIDFGTRPSPGCGDVENCFATTPAGQWMLAHAAEYGFELSFPKDNAQGVTWEPWHWRWVGRSADEPGALAARTRFADARAQFPGDPDVPGIVVRVASQPPVPAPELQVPALGDGAPSAMSSDATGGG